MIRVIREKDDPMALRASIGGGKTAGEGNYYLVYRGDPREVLDMLETVTSQARETLAIPRRPQG
jgi:hypothetical protein